MNSNTNNITYTYECTISNDDDGKGFVRIGWSTADASLQLGTDNEGYGYGSSGVKVSKNKYDPYPSGAPPTKIKETFNKGDIIGCHLQLISNNNHNDNSNSNQDAKESKNDTNKNVIVAILSYSKNGKFIGNAFDIQINTSKKVEEELCFYPTICLKNSECQLNFGAHTPFQYNYSATTTESKTNNDMLPLSKIHNHHISINPRDALSSTSLLSSELLNTNTTVNTSSTAEKNDVETNSSRKKGPLAIIIEPTRDLAEQTYNTFNDICYKLSEENNSSAYDIKSALLIGGGGASTTGGGGGNTTLKLLKENKCDVLIGTPPIITSYIKKKIIACENCRFFVLDEADELISNTETILYIKSIYGRLLAMNENSNNSMATTTTTTIDNNNNNKSKCDRLQVCFFSATLHRKEVRELADLLCYQPLWVDLRGRNDSILPDTVEHIVVYVEPSAAVSSSNDGDNNNIALLQTDAVHRKGKLNESVTIENLNLLKKQNIDEYNSECVKQLKPQIIVRLIEQFNMDQVLIFCRTNLDCDLMEKFLNNTGKRSGSGEGNTSSGSKLLPNKYSCSVLAGMRSMSQRQKSLQDFKDGEVRILIATDVAARGIDIKELPYVINCTIPDMSEIYVHRIGRVGRAERIGLAISLVSTIKERVWFCQKGRKPPCADTRDYDKGGNCIWYDEPKYWKEIENLMKQNKKSTVKLTYPNRMELPSDIERIVSTGGYGSYAGGSSIEPEVQMQMKQIEQQVKELSNTEFALQTDYWNIRNYNFNLTTSRKHI